MIHSKDGFQSIVESPPATTHRASDEDVGSGVKQEVADEHVWEHRALGQRVPLAN